MSLPRTACAPLPSALPPNSAHVKSAWSRCPNWARAERGRQGVGPAGILASMSRGVGPAQVGFLYNHDALHQIAHTAPVAAALARSGDGVSVTILSSSEAQESVARRLVGDAAGAIRFVRLGVSATTERIDRFARHVAPYRRIAVLRENAALLARYDALVAPETTSSMLKTQFGVLHPKLIYIPHGAGDRAVGFEPVTRLFDLVLLSGAKVRDRMRDAGLVRDGHHEIVGYPKFDTIDFTARPKLFGNDRPTVLYNPHFDPVLSSWYKFGQPILRWFARQDRFNLLFCPHMMLFRWRFQVSLRDQTVRRVGAIPPEIRNCAHIRIDTGSPALIDMTYTRAADIYLGDASSQIYEWLHTPRPAIFVNSHGAKWQDNPDYAHWRLGPVVDDMNEIETALTTATSGFAHWAAAHERAFAETFFGGDGASARAAAAIRRFLGA